MKITYTRNGKAVLENTVGVAKDKINEDGSRDSDFIDFVVFEKKAEYLNSYAKKGDKIEINGKLRVDTWKDENMDSHKRIYIVGDSIKILTSRPKEIKSKEIPF